MIVSEQSAKAWVGNLDGSASDGLEKLEAFARLLKEESERQNLIAASTMPHIWQRHIADSAQLLRYVPRVTAGWLDLGTGAGFPGIVIAALLPGQSVVMIESRTRRADWLCRVSEQLNLQNATVIASRLEVVPTRSFAVISARAFAPLSTLLKLAARFSTETTQWILPKGRSAAHEVAKLQQWNHTFHVEQSLTDPDAGIVVGSIIAPKGKFS